MRARRSRGVDSPILFIRMATRTTWDVSRDHQWSADHRLRTNGLVEASLIDVHRVGLSVIEFLHQEFLSSNHGVWICDHGNWLAPITWELNVLKF